MLEHVFLVVPTSLEKKYNLNHPFLSKMQWKCKICYWQKN